MSLRPGVGALAVSDIADVLTTESGCDALTRVGDVPTALSHGLKSMPLGRYLRGKLREALHFPEKTCPPEALQRWKTEMQKLQKEYVDDSEKPPLTRYIQKTEHYRQWLIDKSAQKVLQLETKNKIYSAKRDKL